LSLKLLPAVNQAVPREDGLKARGVECTRFDELEQAGFILGAPGLERDGGEVFGGEDAGGCAVHVSFHGFPQRFLNERSSGRQELDGPACYHDVFALHRAAPRLKILEDGLRADEQAARFWPVAPTAPPMA